MLDTLIDRIEQAIGHRPVGAHPLQGGNVAEVNRVDLADGTALVAKRDDRGGGLEIEGWMLRYLAGHSSLPVPEVLHSEPGLLIMEYIEAGDPITPEAETHAAELLSALHAITAPVFGFDRDTVIGGLVQPNDPTADWVAFFRDRRLLAMGRAALESGRLPGATMARLERFAGRLNDLLGPAARPALIHGDMWSGNVLVRNGRVAGFVDPAIYFADPEIELAFSTLFSTFGEPFFTKYAEITPLRDGLFEVRRDIYNLYPLLVHVRLFGGGYVDSVERILTRFGG